MAEARLLATQLLDAIRELVGELRALRRELHNTKTPTGGSDG
jgi:hypothetical protein